MPSENVQEVGLQAEISLRDPGTRPAVRGKFLFTGREKLYLRGVTYGPFYPTRDGSLYGDPSQVHGDLAMMAANGINAVRTYTVPPTWLLDAAQRHGLRVLVGLSWEQHIAFLDDAARADGIERSVRDGVRACRRHPAVLAYSIGNEIPASIVRWHGADRVEAFLQRLYKAVKEEDDGALVTYVNFPPTEYLQLAFVDFISFNVYLEQRDRLHAYLARLQNLVGDKPLVMAEVGLDSLRNGAHAQAQILDWQVRTVFASGAAGVFVFAWTDEWSRGGFEIDDWDFGLTTRSRRPKPALDAVAQAFRDVPFPAAREWPRFSVVLCSYNGGRTIRQTLEELAALDYPSYEIIVVDDGSTDATAEIAGSFPAVRVISIPNGGLSAARNVGMNAATGDIIAYIDDDAYPDRQWLRYLATAFRCSAHAAIGGPNIQPPGDGAIAECVANAPGGPIHVLLSDDLAEHIPGCNFAVRRETLQAIGGFDPLYRAAGDDVDVCWRLQERGETIGFCAAAVVWHHRRNSIGAYWRQQRGYGQAEALLERKWPLKYNAAGHLRWSGRLYGSGVLRPVHARNRIYQGMWGTALFQRLYEPTPGLIQTFAQMPEWYLLAAAVLSLGVLGVTWRPLALFLPLGVAALMVPIVQAVAAARHSQFPSRRMYSAGHYRLVLLTACLFVIQPFARLRGRIGHGLTAFRRSPAITPAQPRRRTETVWSETWRAPEQWLHTFQRAASIAAFVRCGGDYDRWDLEIRGGIAAAARIRLGVEEHGDGRQLLRWRIWPRFSALLLGASAFVFLLGIAAAAARAVSAWVILEAIAVAIVAWIWRDARTAVGAAMGGLRGVRDDLR